jgi:hypothetical protein
MRRLDRIACGAALVLSLSGGCPVAPPVLAVGPQGTCGACNKGDRALVNFIGRVAETTLTQEGDGTAWVAAVLELDGPTQQVRVRIAPHAVLEQAAFHVTVGHRLQVRAFAGGPTYDVQRLRDRDTGRVLRLRSLRGEPLWHAGAGHHHGGGGMGPLHHPERGHGPGRG